MSKSSVAWLRGFSEDAEATDQLRGQGPDYLWLLALGLLGEAGSVLAEVKKGRREGAAYPSLGAKLREEIGDFLWYYVRLVSVLDQGLLGELAMYKAAKAHRDRKRDLGLFLGFGAAVGGLLESIRQDRNNRSEVVREALWRVWDELNWVSVVSKVPLNEAALANIQKRSDRWPSKPRSLPLFDESYPKEEQLPRRLEIEFLECRRKGRPVVILRYHGINIGDRLTDNIEEADEYRYHDIFHLGHMAFLGWSPVTRSLLRCKRKSRPSVDENEDGGRAQVIEEAISAVVFSRAKGARFFEGIDHLDYDLLKGIQGLVKGYEVDRVPLWQWERAILRSYEIFRALTAAKGGRVVADLHRRRLDYLKPR